MRLINIYNKKSKIYLFLRDENRNLKLRTINTYNPYYYEPQIDQSVDSDYIGYDGTKLERIEVSNPSDIYNQKSNESYEATVHYTSKYILDHIPEFTETYIKYAMIDIEVLHDGPFPEAKEAKYPVSCISLYNSKSDSIKTWCLLDYGIPTGTRYSPDNKKLLDAEIKLFMDFVDYMRKAKFDLFLGFFMDGYDFPFLFNRFNKLPKELFFDNPNKYDNFAKAISPIGETRRGSREFDNQYPAGTSVVDYLTFIKAVFKNEKSYKLDDIMEKYLGVGKEFKEVDFTYINETVRQRNIGDVVGMKELEQKKFKLIPFYDDVRRTSRITWESLSYPLRIVEPFFLAEAHKQGLILPDKRNKNTTDKVEGAYREAFETGRFTGLSFYDLSGAYLNTVVDLCLDAKNITDKKGNTLKVKVTDRVTQEIIKTYNIYQYKNSLFPKVASDLLNKKQEYKDLKNNTNINAENYKDICKKYDTYKSITLSSWGVLLNKHFRLFSPEVASMITSTVRDLIHYTKDKLEERGYGVKYIDTDSCAVVDNGKDINKLMNEILQQWSMERFNKKSSIVYDYEGTFDNILITGKCRYVGYKGEEKVIKGVEIKRKDSTPYMAQFQNELFEKILDKNYEEQKTKKEIIKWIKSEMERIKTVPLMDIAKPCKIGNKIEDYKVVPIFVRALKYTQEILPNFKKRVGELYYHVYVNTTKYEEEIIKEPFKDGLKLTNKPLIELAKKYLPKLELTPKTIKTKDKKDLLKLLENKGEIYWVRKKVQGKLKNVLAFDEKNQAHVKDINWNEVIRLNLLNKVEVVFRAMNWDFNELIPIKPKLTIKKSIKTPSGPSKPSLIKHKPLKG